MDTKDKPMAGGLWRDNEATKEGKYLVKRRDGSIPEWPHFTLGAKDPCAPNALRAYARAGEKLNMDRAYTDAVFDLADEFEEYRMRHGNGDPERGRHREDDPAIIAEMCKGHSV